MSSGSIQAVLIALLAGASLAGRAQAPKPSGSQASHPSAKAKGRRKAPAPKRLDINTATKAQLAKVPGLTEALADQIIAHRPYLTKEHLVLNHVLPEPLFLSIRQYVTAIPPGAKKLPARPSGAKQSAR